MDTASAAAAAETKKRKHEVLTTANMNVQEVAGASLQGLQENLFNHLQMNASVSDFNFSLFICIVSH